MNQKYLVNTGAYGFLDEVYEIRILLCYLIKNSPKPLTHDQITEIATKNNLINYFYLEDAIGGLVSLGYAALENAPDGKAYYLLTQKGEEIESEFKRCIPRALRDRIIDEAINLFAQIRRDKDVKCSIEKTDSGYEVHFTLLSENTVIADTKMFAPDISTANFFAKRINDNPSAFYTTILSYLSDGYDKVKINESPLDNIAE